MLRGVETRLTKLEEYTKKIDSSNYDWHHDKDANLDIIFKNDRKIHLPVIPFRIYQLEIQRELFLNGRRFFDLEWPRRAGKEVTSWNILIHAALLNPGLYLMIYPTNVRAKMILWKGSIVLDNGEGFKFIKMVPIKFVAQINNIDMTIDLINGSVIKIIGSDTDPDKLRGTNARGVVISEYAFCDPRVRLILMPVLRQNGGWMILQSTPNGMNHAYDLMRELKGNPEWFCRTETCETLLDANGNRYVTDAMIAAERAAGMPEWLIEQEYYCKVESNSEIYYFSKEMAWLNSEEDRIMEGLILEKPVYNALDIGWGDTCAVTQFQLDKGGWPLVVNYFEKNNRPFEYYVQECERFCVNRNLRMSTFFAPHDGENHAFATGKNVVDVGQDIGVDVQVVKRPPSMMMAIQSMRRMLPKTRFNKSTTERLRQCLSNYQKEYDEKMGVYKKDPLHNWASHGTKSFQTMTYAIEEELINENTIGIGYYNR